MRWVSNFFVLPPLLIIVLFQSNRPLDLVSNKYLISNETLIPLPDSRPNRRGPYTAGDVCRLVATPGRRSPWQRTRSSLHWRHSPSSTHVRQLWERAPGTRLRRPKRPAPCVSWQEQPGYLPGWEMHPHNHKRPRRPHQWKDHGQGPRRGHCCEECWLSQWHQPGCPVSTRVSQLHQHLWSPTSQDDAYQKRKFQNKGSNLLKFGTKIHIINIDIYTWFQSRGLTSDRRKKKKK